MALIHFLRYVRPDEEWSRLGTMSGSSEVVGFEATRANKGDPSWGWWAGSGSASLTSTFAGAGEVGIVALIHTNADDGNVITVSGAVAGTVPGARSLAGYPRNVALFPTPASGGAVTVAIGGNSINWAIGQLVAGKLREFPLPTMKPGQRTRSRAVIGDISDDGTDHEIRIDLGTESWSMSGRLYEDDPALDEFQAMWEATKAGVIPILIVPNEVDDEPRYVRMERQFGWSNEGKGIHYMDFTFREAARGILVV